MLILLCILTSPVAAISVDAGETWIAWKWSLDAGQTVDVYVNGVLVSENGTANSYLLSGIDAGERAHIVICNATSGEILISNYAETTSPLFVNIAILAIMIVLAIVSYVVDYKVGIAIGAFNCLVGIVLLNLSIGAPMLPYLGFGTLAFQATILGIVVYGCVAERLEWF